MHATEGGTEPCARPSAACSSSPSPSLVVAACSSAGAGGSPRDHGGCDSPDAARAGRPCGSATSPTSRTPPRSSASRRASSTSARRQRHARDAHLQRRPRGGRGAASPRRSTSPTSARTRRSTPSRSPNGEADPDRLRRDVRRRVPRRQARRSRRRADLEGKKLATPAARQHAGRGAARLAEGAGLSRPTTAGGGDVSILPQENAQTLETFQRRRRSTAPGCPSRGPRASCWRAAARCSSTSATCGRTASS